MYELRVFSGRAHPAFAKAVALSIESQSSLENVYGGCDIRQFADGEIWVKFQDNIRGRDVFLVQPTFAPSDNLFELLLMIDAAKRASAHRITVVLPYFGYARQDRKDQPRVAISARLIADMISTAGADRVLTMDLHASQIQGFFNIPVDHLYAAKVFTEIIRKQNHDNLCVVSPDVGNIKVARAYAKRLNADLAIVDKRRASHNVAEAMNILGEVKDKNILLLDDIVDTAGTLSAAARVVKEQGAKTVTVACTHAVLSGDAVARLEKAGVDQMYISDTIPLRQPKPDWMQIVSVADEFGKAITFIHDSQSVSSMFD